MAEKTEDETVTGTTAATAVEPDAQTAERPEEAAAGPEDTAAEEHAEPAGAPSGTGQGAAAVVSAALGLVSLTGGWPGTVAAARETLVGQLRTAADASVATQIKEVYGDAWNTTALWGGLFALVALITGVVVLVRPAFGAPGRTAQAPWTRSVAWAGVTLGVIGLLLAVLTYTGVLLGLPAAS
ncbi:hypothetical protein ACWDLL_15220 [Streptomyces griseoincarnatus]|uniref:hypothetical protein n=1 Tax=unclassified Streptomyces TaxID=2593676 RepID=UPI000C88B4C1|nr:MULTISPECIES: hypothetical protein [unclassified Streptomyces]MBJ6643673.1 hypothetical protein [Streptomyces sp. BSE7-9]MCA2200719.1 hypothetical protein [Streptomyces sp. SMS_SU21]NEA95464.1 hypothetical protein [Actinospica acidiphila]PWE09521.1 hypothetical protein DD630_24040 [Streptomyces sp. BSE7F]